MLDGRWVGLHEPVAPRVDVGGLVFSPIDAVRRVLVDEPGAIRLSEIATRLISWISESQSASSRQHFTKTNQIAWNQLASDSRFCAANTDPVIAAANPTAIDAWLDDTIIKDTDVLCLAAGGGLHAPLFAAAGARVTVVDISDNQLQHDRRIAKTLGLTIRTVQQSIHQLDEIATSSYDIVIQPVSSCYLPNLSQMFAEIARVTRIGGLYVSQHKQPASLQASTTIPLTVTAALIEGQLLPTNEAAIAVGLREPGTAEYLHTLNSLIGGICQNGFVIEDFAEPTRGDAFAPVGSAAHRACFLPPYLKIKARRK
jgi:SAM-dependent methyltransferase